MKLNAVPRNELFSWVLISAFWPAVGLVFIAVGLISDPAMFDPADRRQLFLDWFTWIEWSLFTLPILLLARRIRRSASIPVQALAHVTGAALFTALHLTAYLFMEDLVRGSGGSGLDALIAEAAGRLPRHLLYNPLIYGAIAVAGSAVHQNLFWAVRDQQTRSMEQLVARAELDLLRAQIRPAFISETLASIDSLIEQNSLKAEEAVLRLSDYLRLTLRRGRAEESTVEEDMEIVRAYFEVRSITRACFPVADIRISASAARCRTSPAFVQTLLEHASAVSGNEGIVIEADTEGQTVKVRVRIASSGTSDLFLPSHQGGPEGSGARDLELTLPPENRTALFVGSLLAGAAALATGTIYLSLSRSLYDYSSPAETLAGWLVFVVLVPLVWRQAVPVAWAGWKARLPRIALLAVLQAIAAEVVGAITTSLISGTAIHLKELALMTFDDGMRVKFIFAFAVLHGLHSLHLRRERIEREDRAARLADRLSSIRLSTLKMQLHPHFLFNALNSVIVLLRRDPMPARQMLSRLSMLFEWSFDLRADHEVTLTEELELLGHYLEIEKVRFGKRLRIRIDVEEEVIGAPVPPLILQPIAENAIRHGIAKRAAGGCVEIRARRRGPSLVIEIEDDGDGLESGDVIEGMGLSNCRMRLECLYGNAHAFAIHNAPGGGVIVRLEIPMKRHPKGYGEQLLRDEAVA